MKNQNKTISVVLYPRKGKNNKYPVKIRFTENRKSKYITLPIKIEKRYWLNSTRRVSSSHRNHIEFNFLIESKLNEFQNTYKTSSKFLEKNLNVFDDLEFKINKVLKDRFGYRKKHKTLYFHLNKFWGGLDLHYFDIDREFFIDFKNYLSENIKSRSSLNNIPSDNTIIGYLKIFRTFLYEQKKEGKITIDISFLTDVFPSHVTSIKKTLDLDDIWILNNIQPHFEFMRPILFNSLNTFMFNFFSQGLRIGDTLRLKWGNIEDDLLIIKMSKTGRTISIPLTGENCYRLFWYLEDFPYLFDWNNKQYDFQINQHDKMKAIKIHNSLENKYSDKINNKIIPSEIHNLSKKYRNEFIKEKKNPYFNETLAVNFNIHFTNIIIWEMIISNRNINFDFNFNFKNFNHIPSGDIYKYSKIFNNYVKGYNKKITDLHYEMIKSKSDFLENIVKHVIEYAKREENKNKFIFPFLKGLENENDINKLNNKISSSTTLINRSLQEIGTEIGLNKKITNHISRHSITSISKSLGVDVYDLKNMLGHTSVKQTEVYINSLSTQTSLENTKKIVNILNGDN